MWNITWNNRSVMQCSFQLSSDRRCESVAKTTHGLDISLVSSCTQDSSQSLHVQVYRALIDFAVAAPYPVQQLSAIERFALIRHEKFEQPVLHPAQIDQFALSGHPVGRAVEHQSVALEGRAIVPVQGAT